MRPPFPPVPGPVEDTPLGDPALTEPLPPISSFDVQPAAEEHRRPGRCRRAAAGPLHAGRRGPGRDRARRPLPRPLRARGRRRRGGQRRDDRGPRRGGRGARRPPAPLGRLLRRGRDLGDRAIARPAGAPAGHDHRRRRRALQFRRDRDHRRRDRARPAWRASSCRSRPASRSARSTSRRPRRNVLLRLPQQGYPFPELGLRDIVLDPETHVGDYTLPLEPGPRARFAGFTTEGDLAFDAEHVGVLAALPPRRPLRPPQGRRSARGDGLDAAVQHRLGRAGADRRDAPRTAPNMSTSWSARTPARPRSIDATRRLQHRRGLPARRRLGASQPVPARRRAARSPRSPARRSRISASASAATIGASATARCCSSSRSAGAIIEAFQGYTTRLYGLVAANRRRSGRSAGPMPMAPRSSPPTRTATAPPRSRCATPISSAG